MVRILIRTVGVFFAISTIVGAVAAAPPSIETRVKRVALFKNGLGFFVREGTLSPAREAVVVGPFSAPVHGTFWVSAPSRAGLSQITVRDAEATAQIPARDMAELLKANIGRNVTIWTGTDPESAIEGAVLSFAPDRARPPVRPFQIGSQPDASHIFPPTGPGQYVLIETEEGAIAINPHHIVRIAFEDDNPNTSFAQIDERVEMDVSFENARSGDWLSVSYLAKGITWVPSYIIDISSAATARLAAKALIVNEAEDIDAAHVDLITGFPNLQFSDVLSPMGRKQDLAGFLQSLGRRRTVPAASVMTQRVQFEAASVAAPLPDYGAAAAGQFAEDLFFYPLEDVTLKQGETGYYPLFTESVPYEEFYEWKIPDYIDERDRYSRQRGEEMEEQIVWHAIRLTNTAQTPWTTAPAQLMKDGQIIGQDTLNYTAPKAESVVRITQAVSVKAEQTEFETKRERAAVVLYGDSFDRVTIEGTLAVTNYKDEAISLEITKTLSGEVKRTSPKAMDATLARGLRAMNPTHELKWSILLEAGESREVTYAYEALIRR